jgi:LPXTG-site transpeptidase (sortase) family protein
VAVVMLVAAIAGVVALVFAVRPVPTSPAYTASAPPLALSSNGRSPLGTPTPPLEEPAVRIEAPAGKIDLGLVEGDGVHVPLNLASHYPGTAQPGYGNAVYYAHAQPGMFLGLYSLHLGDEIRIIRADGTQLIFHATAFKKVAYNDRAVLNPTPFPELTLLTCTTYDPYTPRYIVIAT